MRIEYTLDHEGHHTPPQALELSQELDGTWVLANLTTPWGPLLLTLGVKPPKPTPPPPVVKPAPPPPDPETVRANMANFKEMVARRVAEVAQIPHMLEPQSVNPAAQMTDVRVSLDSSTTWPPPAGTYTIPYMHVGPGQEVIHTPTFTEAHPLSDLDKQLLSLLDEAKKIPAKPKRPTTRAGRAAKTEKPPTRKRSATSGAATATARSRRSGKASA